jgi:aminodeoxychorismate lyase
MIVFLRGQFIPEEQAVVSIFDRGFRYGDALFEAVLVRHGKMFRWAQHLARLQRSAEFLKISLPYSANELHAFAQELIARNELADCVLRLQISRGTSLRGYAPTGNEVPFIVMTAHPTPTCERTAWKLVTSPLRVAATDRLQGHKTANRLLQIMAGMHAREHGADESLILTTDGHVTEGSTSNVFWIDGGVVCTPPLTPNVLPGVTRAAVFEVCDAIGLPRAERNIRPEELFACEGVFVTFTSRGVVEASSLDGKPLQRSPITQSVREAFENLLARECA